MLRIVVDTNIWVRILLGGPISVPVLEAFQKAKFQLIVSEALLEELRDVVGRPRLSKRIDSFEVQELLSLLTWGGEHVVLKTIPPRCRDPKDHPVLATAIDGRAHAIVTGDDDLRADEELRQAMAQYGIQLWGVSALLESVS